MMLFIVFTGGRPLTYVSLVPEGHIARFCVYRSRRDYRKFRRNLYR